MFAPGVGVSSGRGRLAPGAGVSSGRRRTTWSRMQLRGARQGLMAMKAVLGRCVARRRMTRATCSRQSSGKSSDDARSLAPTLKNRAQTLYRFQQVFLRVRKRNPDVSIAELPKCGTGKKCNTGLVKGLIGEFL